MVARGHNVAPPFLAPWLALGGVAGIGLPLTEAFVYHGMPTQYFDDVALRIGPHGLTTAPIGVVALQGALPRAKEMPRRSKHVYDRVTGSLWQAGFYAADLSGPRLTRLVWVAASALACLVAVLAGVVTVRRRGRRSRRWWARSSAPPC